VTLCASALMLLPACSPSSSAGIDLPALDPRVTSCAAPVTIEGELTGRDVQQGWARDRLSLVQCRDNLGAVVGYYDGLRSDLAQ
jgi:hypothetical protein